MGQQLMAVVAEGHRGRKYLEATEAHVAAAEQARPEWGPEQELAYDPRNLWCIPYGLTTFADLFTPRQLVALGTFSDLVGEARDLIRKDALASGLPEELAAAYSDAVATYLTFGVGRVANRASTICIWT
jgi:putative DNA methylase